MNIAAHLPLVQIFLLMLGRDNNDPSRHLGHLSGLWSRLLTGTPKSTFTTFSFLMTLNQVEVWMENVREYYLAEAFTFFQEYWIEEPVGYFQDNIAGVAIVN